MKRLFLALALMALAGPSVLRAEDAKFTALFIMNFAKYVEWPGGAGDFVITVLGNDPVIDELKIIAEKTKIGERALVIQKAGTPDQVGKCDLVYLPPDKKSAYDALAARFGNGVLIVTNADGMAQKGAPINLATIDGKQKFEINPEGLKKSGLGAKPVLFKLGKVVGS